MFNKGADKPCSFLIDCVTCGCSYNRHDVLFIAHQFETFARVRKERMEIPFQTPTHSQSISIKRVVIEEWVRYFILFKHTIQNKTIARGASSRAP